MIHFEHREYLWLLVVVLAGGLLWAFAQWRTRRQLERWADRPMLGRLIPDRCRWRPTVKMALTLTGVALLVVAMANPQFGTRLEKTKHSGSDIAICIDLSNSMMAEDIQPNRLERSKRVVNSLLASLGGDRVSLVAFAGQSFIQMPLTNDYSATKLFLDDLDCSMISTQGTAIGDAIDKAMQTFGYGDEDREWEKNKGRAIIVISDGENHEDDAVGAARNAAREGVKVCAIGMGLPDGAPIPEYDHRTRKTNYKRERGGSIIMTHLNEQMLREIADAGGGVYVRASSASSGVGDILELISKLEKEEYGEAELSAFESRYHYPLAAGLICLLAELLLFERRNRKWSFVGFSVLLLMLLTPADASAQASRHKMREGNRQYNKEHYDQAELQYRRALERDSTDARGHYNLANALYRQQKYDEAVGHYEQALSAKGDKQRARALHNRGNSLLKAAMSSGEGNMEQLQQALASYQEALKLDPKNDDTRYNLALARHLLKQAQQQQQQQGGGDNQQQDKQNQQNKDQQNQQNKDQQQQQNQQQQNQQDQQNQQQQNQQDQQNQQQQKKEQQGQEAKKRDAERMLEAMKNNERQTMRERERTDIPIKSKSTDKDW